MTTVLQTIGQNFRVVGPLTLANRVINPNFAASDPITLNPTDWFVVGYPVFTSRIAADGSYCSRLDFPTSGIPNVSTQQGFYQNLPDQVQQEAPYYLHVDLLAPSQPIPTQVLADVDFIGYDGTTLSTQTNVLVNSGFVTTSTGWVSVSATVTTPVDTATVRVRLYVIANLTTIAIPPLWIRNVLFTENTGTYVDGDTAGYVWSDTRFTSTTLQSTMPSDLHAFSPTLVSALV